MDVSTTDEMDHRFESQLQFLRGAGTQQLPHTQRDLLDHLIGTRQLLANWGARPMLCDAGLFHSVYGTEHYSPKAVPLVERAAVQELIGNESEMLVWLFCVMRRDTFDQNLGRARDFRLAHRVTGEWIRLTELQFHDLVTLTFANTLEAFPRLAWSARRAGLAYLRPFLPVAIPSAQATFAEFDSPWWRIWSK